VTAPSIEEQQAIRRLKQGDLGGLEALVRRYQVRAVYAAYLIVRDMDSAEDIVQEAFLHAAEKIDQFDASRPFFAWFMRSVVNAAIKAAGKQKRFLPIGDAEDSGEDETVGRMAAWLVDPDPCPEALVETEETRRQVWKALEVLTTEQRAAVVMRHFLEMSEAEMTQELGRPLSTIRWRLKTARNRLRDLLQPMRLLAPHDREDEDQR
jgi:RNA polymerase sigma-70 factor, ECF subfamily